MASRKITEIFDAGIAEKETFSSLDTLVPNPDTAQTFLDDLTTPSKVAIWRLDLWVMSFMIWTHEKLFDLHVAEIEAAAKAVTPAVVPWYAAEMKKFQNGFSLTWNEDTFVWEYADTTSAAALAAKIVDHASCRDINQIVTIKVAKTVAGVTQTLTAAEEAAANNYLQKIKIAGVQTLLISDGPDSLKLGITVEYDPQLLDSTGTLISDGVTKPIQVAIDGYIAVDTDGNQGLPFDATFRRQDLVDAIQAASGVVNVVVDTLEASYGAVAYTLILDVVTEDYVPNAGYLQTVDETGSETVPVAGDLNDVSLDALYQGVYVTTGAAYAIGDFAKNDNIMYKSNSTIADPGGAFDPTEWDTVSNLTLISI